MSILRDLDDKLVPRLAAKVGALAGRFPKAPEPAGPLPVVLRLRRVDDRWTSAGPLALLREVPQLGAVAIAALVLAGSVTASGRIAEERRSRTADGPAADAPLGETLAEDESDQLGPVIGQGVDEYLAETRAELQAVAPGRPDGTVIAVVSFAQYQTPEAVRDLLGTSMQAQIVFFRVPTAKYALVEQAPVQDVVGDTKRAFRKAAAKRLADAQQMLDFAATIENDPAQKAEHIKDAALIQQEVKALRGTCKCVFGVVVRAQLRTLLDALSLRSFRAIDVSRVDAKLEDFVRFSALTPGETRTVTGGNQKQQR